MEKRHGYCFLRAIGARDLVLRTACRRWRAGLAVFPVF